MTDDRHDLPEPDDSIEKGLEELKRQAEELKVDSKGDEIDAEFDERMRRLETRVQETKAIRESKQREQKRQLDGDRESSRGLAVGISVAYTIIGVPLGFFAIGALIDYLTDSNVFKAIFVVVGSIVGLSFGIYILQRHQGRS